jgi:membrane-associated progesterone receptor component
MGAMDNIEYILLGGAAALAVYAIVTRYFGAEPETKPAAPKRAAAERRDYSLEELKQFNGTDPSKPILLAVKGKIYDVSCKSSFYGPGGSYNKFTGKDCSRALAKGVVDEDVASNTNLDDLTSEERSTLDEWAVHYEAKYDFVGHVRNDKPDNDVSKSTNH